MADNKSKKNKLSSHLISHVEPGSSAERAGIKAGDVLVSINGKPLKDIFDYHYLSDDERLILLVERGEKQLSFKIVKDLGEDLGLIFKNGLLDDYRSCSNGCIFCFIDQMPPNMRKTLYFKDDDTRLSFLQGNYVTLTNMKDEDLERIISYRMAPINISVHATDPKLRCMMLRNRFAGDILKKMRRIADAGLSMNAQIVLCRGINDGAQLEKTISDLYELYPALKSLSVVPVGLTKYRKDLFPLKPFDRASAIEALRVIHSARKRFFAESGTHFVHASDEWYLLAGTGLPKDEEYDGYPQLENGVGMLRLLKEEFNEALRKKKRPLFMRNRKVSIATGRLAAPFIEELCKKAERRFDGLKTRVYPIRNDFFGEQITVSGLVTGKDLICQLKGRDLGSKLLLPSNMFRAGEKVFLDDVSAQEVSDTLHCPIHIVKSSGGDLLDALLSQR